MFSNILIFLLNSIIFLFRFTLSINLILALLFFQFYQIFEQNFPKWFIDISNLPGCTYLLINACSKSPTNKLEKRSWVFFDVFNVEFKQELWRWYFQHNRDINMFKVRNNDTALVFYSYFEHYFNAMDDLHCIKIMFKVNNKKLKQYRYYSLRTCSYKFCLNIPVQSQEWRHKIKA